VKDKACLVLLDQNADDMNCGSQYISRQNAACAFREAKHDL